MWGLNRSQLQPKPFSGPSWLMFWDWVGFCRPTGLTFSSLGWVKVKLNLTLLYGSAKPTLSYFLWDFTNATFSISKHILPYGRTAIHNLIDTWSHNCGDNVEFPSSLLVICAWSFAFVSFALSGKCFLIKIISFILNTCLLVSFSHFRDILYWKTGHVHRRP